MTILAAAGIPSPSEGVWYIGPVPLRAYGIIIAIGMVVGVWWTARRYVARGGDSDTIYDTALWAIPLGVVGARLYHVVTSPEAYFGPGGDPMLAFQIWRGGLGIWGGVALGALGAFISGAGPSIVAIVYKGDRDYITRAQELCEKLYPHWKAVQLRCDEVGATVKRL